MPDWESRVGRLADRGEERGAAEVFRRARAGVPEMEPDLHRSRRGQLVAVAAVLLLIAGGLGIVLGTGHAGDRVTVTGPTPPDLAVGWARRLKASTGIGEASLSGVAASGSGFVAVGAPVDRARASAPVAVWTSGDGRAWSAVAADELPPGAARLDAVATQPNGTSWIVGMDGSGPAAWRSDGLSWSRSVTGPTSLDQAASFRGLTATATGLIAFGTTADGLGGTWSSSDGKAWRLARLPGPVAAVDPTAERLVALIEVPGAGSRADVVFTSADGAATWTAGAQLGVTTDPAGEALACGDTGCWAATGPVGSAARRMVWHSADGLAWTEVDTTLAADALIDTLTVMGGYLVATGVDHGQPAGWASVDGARWTSMPQVDRTPGGRLDVVAADDTTLVAFSSASELGYFFTWKVP